MYTATTTKAKSKNTAKTDNIKSWTFDDSFYRDLKQATLLGEQIYPLEQALQKTKAFFNELLADDNLQEQDNYLTPLKQMADSDEFMRSFAERLTVSMQLYHFEKQNMLVLKTQTFDELGKNIVWSFFTKEPFCYPLHLTYKNGKQAVFHKPFVVSLPSNFENDYSFSLQEFNDIPKSGENERKLVMENIPSLDSVWTVLSYLCEQYQITDITEMGWESFESFTETHDFLISVFDDLNDNLDAYVHVYLKNFLPKILEFYGLCGNSLVFYKHAKSSVFHYGLNNALYLSNLYTDHQTQLISKYYKLTKLALVGSRVFDIFNYDTLKDMPAIFTNDKTYLQYLLGDDELQFKFTPRYIKFLSEFDPTDIYYATSLGKDLFLFLYNIQHLKAEQLPSGDRQTFCEQSRLLWLHWYLGCQYPANLSVATLKYKIMERYKGISSRVVGTAMWFTLKNGLNFEKDYLNFCYQKLGLSNYLDDIPHELRVGTLKALHDDTIYYHQFYTDIDIFLHNPSGVDNTPPLFNVMKFLGKFDNPSGIKIKQLLTQAEFSQESQRMKHCVSGYYNLCIDGEFAILHLNGLGEQSTLQLGFYQGECEIVQHSGVKNDNPSECHLALANSLCIAFNDKLKRKGNGTRLRHGFEKHQKAIKKYRKANPIDDMSKPFNDDEWERFLVQFKGFKLLPRLKKAINTLPTLEG